MTEGDVWFNTQKTTLHIEHMKPVYWCGLPILDTHRRYIGVYGYDKDLDFAFGSQFCRRCVKIKMQWAWKK